MIKSKFPLRKHNFSLISFKGNGDGCLQKKMYLIHLSNNNHLQSVDTKSTKWGGYFFAVKTYEK